MWCEPSLTQLIFFFCIHYFIHAFSWISPAFSNHALYSNSMCLSLCALAFNGLISAVLSLHYHLLWSNALCAEMTLIVKRRQINLNCLLYFPVLGWVGFLPASDWHIFLLISFFFIFFFLLSLTVPGEEYNFSHFSFHTAASQTEVVLQHGMFLCREHTIP